MPDRLVCYREERGWFPTAVKPASARRSNDFAASTASGPDNWRTISRRSARPDVLLASILARHSVASSAEANPCSRTRFAAAGSRRSLAAHWPCSWQTPRSLPGRRVLPRNGVGFIADREGFEGHDDVSFGAECRRKCRMGGFVHGRRMGRETLSATDFRGRCGLGIPVRT
jgi:hypothetical protein